MWSSCPCVTSNARSLSRAFAHVGEIVDDDVDAEHLFVGEHQAAVDDDQIVVRLDDRHVAADFAAAAERDDANDRALGAEPGPLGHRGYSKYSCSSRAEGDGSPEGPRWIGYCPGWLPHGPYPGHRSTRPAGASFAHAAGRGERPGRAGHALFEKRPAPGPAHHPNAHAGAARRTAGMRPRGDPAAAPAGTAAVRNRLECQGSETIERSERYNPRSAISKSEDCGWLSTQPRRRRRTA